MNDLEQMQEASGAQWMGYGPDDQAVRMAALFDGFATEYAAIRRRVGLMVLPHRAILRATGSDRLDFLQRMLTQEVLNIQPGHSRRSFQLSEKGRILADLVVHHGDLDTWLEMDRFDLPTVKALYESRLFTEDLTFEDWTQERMFLALHGPSALACLQAVVSSDTAPLHAPGTHHVLTSEHGPISVFRRDLCAVPGLTLMVPAQAVAPLYQQLLKVMDYEPGVAPDAQHAQKRREGLRGQPVGWYAFNTTRIEAGTALFHVDYGPTNLPAETGQLDQTTSFTKGCYLGQEIVSRMKHLGHPKQVLVALRADEPLLPQAGEQIHVGTGENRKPVGVVTSSTLSPLLSQSALALALVKWAHHSPGTQLLVPAEGKELVMSVQETLAAVK